MIKFFRIISAGILSWLVSKLKPSNHGREMLNNDITLQIGSRWAASLRKRFGPKNTAKLIAAAFNVEIRTARSWLSGSAPFIKHLYLAGEKFGAVIIAEVLMPNNVWFGYARLENHIEELGLKICQIRDDIHQLRKGDNA